ncbi:MAG: hypothetical protein WDO74_01775 [Pseudomonadota bacterium]
MALGNGEMIGLLVESHEFGEQGSVTELHITQTYGPQRSSRGRARIRYGSGYGGLLQAARHVAGVVPQVLVASGVLAQQLFRS